MEHDQDCEQFDKGLLQLSCRIGQTGHGVRFQLDVETRPGTKTKTASVSNETPFSSPDPSHCSDQFIVHLTPGCTDQISRQTSSARQVIASRVDSTL